MLVDLLLKSLGRDRAWRLGRKLYMQARGDVDNNLQSNGELALIRRALANYACQPSGPTFTAFDVGANLGLWTKLLLSAADKQNIPVSVEVFEPAPCAYERLSANLSGEQRTFLHPVALSDRLGTAEMEIVGDYAGTNTLTAVGALNAQAVEVPVKTVDSIKDQRGIAEIDLLKIDAEGHDLVVLQGAKKALSEGAVGIVQFEYNWRWIAAKNSMRDVFELAKQFDYRVGLCSARDLITYVDWAPELDRYFENNYVLLRPDIAEKLDARMMRWSTRNTLALA